MVNHSSRRINKVVYDQQSEGICFAIALSDSVTCLYKLRYLSKMKRLGKSRRRLNKLKLFRLSPQSLIDKGFKGLKNTSWYITDVRKGFQHVGVYRVARIKGCENYQLGKHYPVDGVKMYRGEPYIKAKLEKHFGPGGPKHSVVGCVFMGELTSKKAKEAYEKNTPYKHPELFDNLRDADHAIVITGIYTDGKPENHFVELKNSYGLAWGHEGYTKVAFSFIKMIMIPCMEEKEVNSSVTNMARKKSLSSLMESDLKGKRVFFRADLNVPLDGRLEIIDDALIHVAVPTIKYLTSNGARVIVSSHLGRPKGVNAKLSLKPLVPRLSELLGIEVKMADDCVGPDVEKLVAEIREGGVLLLENLMFYKEEEENDPEFAKKLASLADLYVIDGFGTAHMANASTDGVAKHLKPCFAGFMQKERDFLVGTASNPKKPVAAIVGGSKMSSKISLIQSLLNKVEIIILGGGMIFTFYKAQGLSVGSSLVEEDNLILAASLLEKAKAKGVSLLLPSDVVIADKFAPDANSKIVPASSIPDDWMGLDIGPDTIKSFSDTLDTTKAVIWNGPMGVSQFEKFAAGTEAIAHKLVDLSGKGVTTIIGGGALVAAVEKVGLADKMSYISTGGGASLELLEGNPLLGVLPPDET